MVSSSFPLERTLRDYTHYFKNKPGFKIVNDQLLKEVEMTLSPERKYVALLIDEIKQKEGLAYKKMSGKIVGFVNIGDINQQL